MTIKLKTLIKQLLISLGVGGLAALLTRGNMDLFETINKPSFSPPAILFPIVWTILYILMGISAYMIAEDTSKEAVNARRLYAAQLFFNFFWSLIFFNGQWYLAAFIWLVVLWSLIFLWILSLMKVKILAGVLQIPYLLWVTFAGWLNLAIWLLNR